MSMKYEMEVAPFSRRALWLTTLAFEGGLAVTALVLGWLTGVDPRETLLGGPVDLVWGLVTAAVLLVGFGLAYRSRWGPLSALRDQVLNMVWMLFGRSRWPDLFFAAAAAGIGEELFFRGWLQPFLGRYLGAPGGLMVASLIFGLAHPHSPIYFILAAGLGLLFGWLWLATGSLIGPIVAHAVYDLVAIAWLRRQAGHWGSGEPPFAGFFEIDDPA